MTNNFDRRNQHSFPLSEEFGRTGDTPEDVKKTYDRTQKSRQLLSQLINVLSELINEWEAFKSFGGDIDYFSDFRDVESTTQVCSHRRHFFPSRIRLRRSSRLPMRRFALPRIILTGHFVSSKRCLRSLTSSAESWSLCVILPRPQPKM